MLFIQLNAGGDRNFAYLIADEAAGRAALVDPADRTGEILGHVRALDLEVDYIINTHGHRDHTAGNATVQKQTGARVVRYDPKGRRTETVTGVRDGDGLEVGSLPLRFIHTPGHTEDSLCILAGDKVCTGDTLFVGKVGGTGLGDDARAEYASLHEKLLTLPDETEVYPGHNYGIAPRSTIGRERRTNPFLLRESFEAFVDLKQNWAAYKEEHGVQ